MGDKSNNIMRVWFSKANNASRKRLAELSGTTLGTLFQLRAGAKNSSGKPNTRPETAIAIEKATRAVFAEDPATFIVRREDLCSGCAGCEFLAAARELEQSRTDETTL